MHTAGRGAFEPSPEHGARTKLFDQEFQFRESHTEAETRKTPDRIPEKKMIMYEVRVCIYICIFFFFSEHNRSLQQAFYVRMKQLPNEVRTKLRTNAIDRAMLYIHVRPLKTVYDEQHRSNQPVLLMYAL